VPPAETAIVPDVAEAVEDNTSDVVREQIEQPPPAEPKQEFLHALKAKLSERDFAGHEPYRVMLVSDGASVVIKVGGGIRRFALVGIDPPEKVRPGPLGEALGRRSREFLKGLLDDQEVYLESDPGLATDRDGRDLVYLYRASDGLFVNLEMLDGGYGFLADDPFLSQELFAQFAEDARQARRGLWGEEIPQSELAVEDGTSTWRRTLELRRQRQASSAVADAAARDRARRRVAEALASQPQVIGGFSDAGLPALDMSRPVHVRGYYRKDGTYVRPHTRSYPSR
jgi:micrococcal nuclease